MSAEFWTDEKVEDLEALWDRPMTTQEIADRLGCTKGQVCGKARRLELPFRPKTFLTRRKRKKRAGKPFELRQRKAATPAPRATVQDFSWHLLQVANGPPGKGEGVREIIPPAGVASWRTFRRRVCADAALRAKYEAAKASRAAPAVERIAA